MKNSKQKIGVLPKNIWHVLVADYIDLLIYEREVGYVEIESQFEISDNIDFGDDLTSMGHKDISSKSVNLSVSEMKNAQRTAILQQMVFSQKGTGTMKVNSKVSSGYKININCEKDATVMAEVRNVLKITIWKNWC